MPSKKPFPSYEYPRSADPIVVKGLGQIVVRSSPPISLNSFLVGVTTSSLLAQVLDELAKLGAGLLADLVLGRAHDGLEDREELAGEALDSGLLGLEHGDNHVEDGLVLAEVVPEREELDEAGQDLWKGHGLGVGLDHAGQAASGVVDETSAGVVSRLGAVNVKDGLEDLEDGAVVVDDVFVGAVGAKETSAEGGVGLGLRVLVL